MDHEKEIEQIKRRIALGSENDKQIERCIRLLSIAIIINSINLVILAFR